MTMKNDGRYDVYIASCAPDGGIYHYEMCGGDLSFKEKTECDCPMYLADEDGKMYTILKHPYEQNQYSALTHFDINSDGSLGKRHETVSTKGEVACHLAVETEVYTGKLRVRSVYKAGQACYHWAADRIPTRQIAPHAFCYH